MSQPHITHFFHKRQAVAAPGIQTTADATSAAASEAADGIDHGISPAEMSDASSHGVGHASSPPEHPNPVPGTAPSTGTAGPSPSNCMPHDAAPVQEHHMPHDAAPVQEHHSLTSLQSESRNEAHSTLTPCAPCPLPPPTSHVLSSSELHSSSIAAAGVPSAWAAFTDVQCLQHLTSEYFYDQPLYLALLYFENKQQQQDVAAVRAYLHSQNVFSPSDSSTSGRALVDAAVAVCCDAPQNVGALLHWIACQAAEAKSFLEKCPLPLLHQLSHDGPDIACATSAVTTRQCCQLLAGMLLGCFTRGRRSLASHSDAESWPSTSFAALSSMQHPFLECVMHYFYAVSPLHPVQENLISDTEHVVFQRLKVGDRHAMSSPDAWMTCTTPLTPVTVTAGTQEGAATPHTVTVDFANKFIGGGALHGGCVQEEIMFALNPEAFVSMLMCQVMHSSEAIIMYGVRTFAAGQGYSRSFTCAGPAPQPFPQKERVSILNGCYNTAATCISAIDALNFRRPHTGDQLSRELLHREVLKAYSGFSVQYHPAQTIITGAWGCGAFKGDRFVKFLVQWCAASAAGQRMVYVAWDGGRGGAKAEKFDQINDFAAAVMSMEGATVGDIATALDRVSDAYRRGLKMVDFCEAGEALDEQQQSFLLRLVFQCMKKRVRDRCAPCTPTEHAAAEEQGKQEEGEEGGGGACCVM